MATRKSPTPRLHDPIPDIVDRIKRKALKHGVKFTVSKTRSVMTGGIECNGFFDDKVPELAVAIDQKRTAWVPVLLHEASHMDQWIEQVPCWKDNKINGIEAGTLVDLWLNHQIELTPEQLDTYIGKVRDVELDCERRTVERIQKDRNKLISWIGMDIDTYIQKANAYLFFYNYLKITRKWYTIDQEPYNIKKIWSKMPKNFENNYTKLPKKFERLFSKHLESSDDTICEKCGEPGTRGVCPYDADVHNNPESYCTCCTKCSRNCSDDI